MNAINESEYEQESNEYGTENQGNPKIHEACRTSIRTPTNGRTPASKAAFSHRFSTIKTVKKP
jgi:hypothetical protein